MTTAAWALAAQLRAACRWSLSLGHACQVGSQVISNARTLPTAASSVHCLHMPGSMQRLPALSAHVGHGVAQEAIQGGLLGASARQRLEEMPGALRQGYATSDLAARVAAVAAAHELAKLAGRVPGGAPASPDDRAAAGEAAASLPLPGSMRNAASVRSRGWHSLQRSVS